MLGAEGRWIVDNMLEVSPGHIRHWEMQGKNEDTTEEVWEGGKFTYSYVPRPFLAHEISKRAREEAEIMKLPHTQLQFAKQSSLETR